MVIFPYVWYNIYTVKGRRTDKAVVKDPEGTGGQP